MPETPWSLALRDIPRPDYADAIMAPLPAGTPVDPVLWARKLFSLRTMPRWVVGALAARQMLVPLLGIPRAADDVFAIREQSEDEVLLGADDRHLDFRCGVAVEPAARLLRVTTTVRLHGWRGRAYFLPVRVLHPLVVRAMIRSAGESLAAESAI
jgi:Protein of unknown function (DUF2867)